MTLGTRMRRIKFSSLVKQLCAFLFSLLREELIKYYDELSREVEHREFRAQWLIRRRLLDSARAQFLAQEQARLDSLMDQITQASGAQNPVKTTDIADARPGKDYEKPEAREKVATPASAPSPSIVSLIASGVKTDALLKAEQGKSTSGLSDSTTTASNIANAQDEQLTVETTSSSEAATAESRARKTWNSPDASAAELEKLTEAGSGRKTWEAPPDGEVKIAAVTPKSHPSESSIQFAMYSDKQKSGEEEKTPGLRVDALKTSTPHVADSSLQNILYPSTPSGKIGLDTQPSSIVTRPSDFDAGGLGVGHPSDSSAQDVLYGSVTEAASAARTPHSQGHPSDYSAQQFLYSGGTQAGTDTEGRSLEHGHPSDASVNDLLYPTTLDTPTLHTPRLPQHGHPSDSQVSLSYAGCGDGLNVAPAMQHSSRSTWQHPSDASVQTLLGNITLLGDSQETTRGTPPSSVAQDILYPGLNEQSMSHMSHTRGTPPQSVAQDILYPQGEESGQALGVVPTRGAPPSSVIQDIMYPSGEGTVGEKTKMSTRGHEPAVKIKNIMYYVKDEKGKIGQKINIWLNYILRPFQSRSLESQRYCFEQ